MSRITSGWRGAKRILAAMPGSLRLRERDRGRDAGSVAEDARGVPAARRVLDQPGVARAEDELPAVAQADLELAAEHADDLAAHGRAPIEGPADRPRVEVVKRRRDAP